MQQQDQADKAVDETAKMMSGIVSPTTLSSKESSELHQKTLELKKLLEKTLKMKQAEETAELHRWKEVGSPFVQPLI